jgi:prevent-host-death family protein
MRAARITDLEFRKQCLKLIDEVFRTRRSIVITRNGVPVARLIPFGQNPNRKVKEPRSLTGHPKAGPSAPRPPAAKAAAKRQGGLSGRDDK